MNLPSVNYGILFKETEIHLSVFDDDFVSYALLSLDLDTSKAQVKLRVWRARAGGHNECSLRSVTRISSQSLSSLPVVRRPSLPFLPTRLEKL